MLTKPKKTITLNENHINSEYRISLFVLEALQMLIGSFLLLSFIMPPTNEQGQERQRDINIALGVMSATQLINLIMRLTESLGSLKPDLRRRLSLAFNHLRAATFNTGILLEFLRLVALLLTETSENNKAAKNILNISDWLSGQSSGARAGIALSAVLARTLSSYLLSKAEFSVTENSGDHDSVLVLLETPKMHERQRNKYTGMRWILNLCSTFVEQYVFSSVPLLITDSFGVPLSKSFIRNFPLSMALLSMAFNAIPDHPTVPNLLIRPKKISRFLDVISRPFSRYAALLFMFHMDFMADVTKKENININNNTAITTIFLYSLLAMHLSEVIYRVRSALNDQSITVSPLLRTWDVIGKITPAIFWWATLFKGNGYVLIPAAIISGSEFLLDSIPLEDYTAQQKLAIQLPKHLNYALFNTGLLQQLAKLTYLTWPLKSAFVVPVALAFTMTKIIAERYPTLNKTLNALEAGLLISGLYNAARQFSYPFGKTLPDAAEYTLTVACTILTLAFLYKDSILAYTRRRKDYVVIEDDTQTKSIQAENPPTENNLKNIVPIAIKTGTLAISTAAFNKAMTAYNTEPVTETGNGMMLLLLGVCTVTLFYILCYNFFYQNNYFDTQSTSNPGSPVFEHKKNSSSLAWLCGKLSFCKTDQNLVINDNATKSLLQDSQRLTLQ